MIARESLLLQSFAALRPVDASVPVSAALPNGAVRAGAPSVADLLELLLDPLPAADRARFPRPRRVVRRAQGFAIEFGEGATLPGALTAEQREQLAPSTREVDGRPVARAAVPIAGLLFDPRGRWLPRRFAANVARGATLPLGLFPAAAHVARTRSGELSGRLALEDGRPLPFAHATLTVTVVGRDPVVLEAQSDRDGALLFPLQALPALPVGGAPHDAQLRVRGARPLPEFEAARREGRLHDPEELRRHAVDVALLVDATLRSGAAFALSLPFTVAPGAPQRLVADGSPLIVRLP
ncbi:MAG: hypothetical protein JNL90_21060 [Planctomycetes bacterium]|nr:hypothetical protein [Planctomycetota bacterium]